MSRIVKYIITGLLIILSITSIFTYNDYKNHQLRLQQAINTKSEIEQSYKIIDKQIIINALNKENKLVCMSGTTTVEATFTNENISDQDLNFKWMKNVINKINSKSVKIQAEIEFDFTYDLSNMPISIHNNTVTITISPNRLSINKCQLVENKSIYNEDIGLLSRRFNSQEINSINGRIKELASNKVLSMENLRFGALENVKSDIYTLIKPLLGSYTNLVFDDLSYDVIQQNDVSIIK